MEGSGRQVAGRGRDSPTEDTERKERTSLPRHLVTTLDLVMTMKTRMRSAMSTVAVTGGYAAYSGNAVGVVTSLMSSSLPWDGRALATPQMNMGERGRHGNENHRADGLGHDYYYSDEEEGLMNGDADGNFDDDCCCWWFDNCTDLDCLCCWCYRSFDDCTAPVCLCCCSGAGKGAFCV